MAIKVNLGLLRSKVVNLRGVCDKFVTDSTTLLNFIDDFTTPAKLMYRDKIVASLSEINQGYQDISTINDATEELASDLLPPLIVPNVIGMAKADAITAITGVGFVTPLIVDRATSPDAGNVIRQYPDAGIKQARSTEIQLFVPVSS